MTAVHKRLAVNGGTIAAFTVAWSEPDTEPATQRAWELIYREFNAATLAALQPKTYGGEA